MIIPLEEITLLYIYECPICKSFYKKQCGKWTSSCSAIHLPGSCCHYGEQLIPHAMLDKIMVMAKGGVKMDF